jgi:DNA-binding transcriptional MerR regulator
MSEQTYSIKDLEDISGIKTHTLRAWERRYKIFSPGRTSTNIRYYSDDDLKKLLNISMLLNYGMKISQVACFNSDELNEKVRSMFSPGDYESLIDNLVINMIDFDELSFEKNINRAIFNLGFEQATYKVIYPFYSKVGMLWQTGSINPAQEHFVTNIIKQKFYLAISSLDVPKIDAKTFILFLPDHELHELSLLLSYYVIRKHGHKAIYLGQSMPMTDIIKTLKTTGADYIVIHFISQIEQDDLLEYLNELSSEAGKTPVLVSGSQAKILQEKPVKNIRFIERPEDLHDLLGNI